MGAMNKAWYAVPVMAFVMTLSANAHGYIDSGTGSYLVQMLLAGALGASFMAKAFWGMLRSKLAPKRVSRDET
jgi:hypothetical protein